MFKRILETLLLSYLALGTAWAAENPFIGNWKLDASKSRFPDEMKVQSKGGDRYAFDFGAGTETIVLDGSFQPGYGGTLLSVKADAPDTWIVERKKDSRLMLKATWTLSKDGRTLADHFRGFQPDGSTISMDYLYQRSGGGSGFVADWKSIKETMKMTSPVLMRVKAFQADGLSFSHPPSGMAENLRFDRREYPDEEPNAAHGPSSSMRRVNQRTLVITDKIDGKIRDTKEMGLSADLKTLTDTVHVVGSDNPVVMVFERMQSGVAGAGR